MATFEEQVAAQYATNNGGLTEIVETPAVAIETPATPPATPPVVETPAVAIETPATPPATPPVVETPKGKSFEEEIAERTGGKYNKWEDLEKELTPKELKFANDKIKRFNELAEKGVDVTSREFLELQGLDVEKADSLFEKWKRSDDGKGLSDSTIKHEINKKYNVEEWQNKDEDELTQDDIANKEKMIRDINSSKEWLTNYKNERVLEKQIDPAVAETMVRQREEQLNSWDKMVDTDIINKVAKLSSPISYKDETGKVVESSVDYEISADDKKYVSDLFKQLPRDPNAFFNQFKDDKGNQNHEALASLILKARNYDKAVADSYTAGAEQRALQIEKTSKNTNFAPAAASSGVKILTPEEAQQEAIRNGIKNQ